jgi:hypothetical protein
MHRTVSLNWAATFIAPLQVWSAAHAQTVLTIDDAREVVAPLYEALNQPAKKDVPALLENAASPNWQSCGANDQCAPRERVITGIKGRGATNSRPQMGDQGAAGHREPSHCAGRGLGDTGRAAL